MKTFLKFLTSRGVLITTGMVIVYGFLIFTIYFTGYHAMPQKFDTLPITVVNRDSASKQLAKQLRTTLPFKHVHQTHDLSAAKRQMNARKTYLIIDIPDGFASTVKQNQPAKLNFYVNDAVQTSVSSGMMTVAETVGKTVNQQVMVQKSEAVLRKEPLAKLKQVVAAQQQQLDAAVASKQQQISAAPAPLQQGLQQQLQSESQQKQKALDQASRDKQTEIQQQVQQKYAPVANSVTTNIHRMNKVRTGLNYSLAPFILTLAMYIGALLGSLLLYGTYVKFAGMVGRFKAFGMLEISMILISIIAAAAVVAAVMPQMQLTGSQFGALWLNHGLEMFAAFNLNSVLILLMGQMGTSLNIFLTMLQVVAGAGMIPLVAMNHFYAALHFVAPMFYTIAGDMNIMYGGTGTGQLWGQFALLIGGLILINLLIVTFRKRQPVLDFAKLS
ncbi:hypothetical protein LSI01_11340 [Furfurilactobacillus siliginis]|nr:hypothetical protein LSI01_11340 [Furfurilactobacillus siliginis]